MSSDSSNPSTPASIDYSSPSQDDSSSAVNQITQQNNRQDDQIAAIANNESAVDRAIAQLNPFSPSGYIAQINRNHRNNMIDAIEQGGQPIFDNGIIKGVATPVKGLFGLDQIEYVGNPDYNPNAGYNMNIGNVGGNYGQVLG